MPVVASGGICFLTWITKVILNFASKVWCMLVHHCLSPTNRDNFLTLEKDALLAGIMDDNFACGHRG